MANRVDMKKPLTAKEAIDFLDELDDETIDAFYILPPEVDNGALSGEDDADEDDGGIFDDICGGQLKSNCELVFTDGRRITTVDGCDDNEIEDELANNNNLTTELATTNILLGTSLQQVVATPSCADNAVVNIASTCYGVQPVKNVQRYSQQQKKRIMVPRPAVVGQYNRYMCGVDRLDQNVAKYRIGIRGKKWWFCIFSWLIDVCVQNAWQLQRVEHPDLTQLEFRRAIATYYCKHYGEKPKFTGRRKRNVEKTIETTLRYDRTDHLVRPCEKRRRCAGEECSTVGRTECSKCNVGLCVKCFISYHTKPT